MLCYVMLCYVMLQCSMFHQGQPPVLRLFFSSLALDLQMGTLPFYVVVLFRCAAELYCSCACCIWANQLYCSCCLAAWLWTCGWDEQYVTFRQQHTFVSRLPCHMSCHVRNLVVLEGV
jgi:hypothetical protein